MAQTRRPTERTGFQTFETEDGEVIFYDRENVHAWIACDHAIDFGDVRATGPGE